MATPIIMPKQGQSVEMCIITKWHKKKGEQVKTGDILFSYETDKASFDEEAAVEGTLLEIFFNEEDAVPVLLNVCVIGKEGESTAEFKPADTPETETIPAEETSAPAPQVAATAAAPIAPTAPLQPGSSEIRISPRAKNLAKKLGLDYTFASPTGPQGRIIEQDIRSLEKNGAANKITSAAQAAYYNKNITAHVQGSGMGGKITTADIEQIASAGSTRAYTDVPLTNIRKTIAKAMHNSLSSTAQLTLHSSFDAANILELRKQIKNAKDSGLPNITLNDMITFAVSRTVVNHSQINSHFLDTQTRNFNNAHIGFAVDTERGLMVPTIFNANQLNLPQISIQTKSLAEQCQGGTINPDYLNGASFTLTNLGSLGIEYFTPVLNPPQVGILGISTILYKQKKAGNDFIAYPSIGLSLTFDHRALDGAPAARFLQDLVNKLENFSLLFLI